jgi:hypothetical protein
MMVVGSGGRGAATAGPLWCCAMAFDTSEPARLFQIQISTAETPKLGKPLTWN